MRRTVPPSAEIEEQIDRLLADSAPGLIKAIAQCWPASDRPQHCAAHRVRNLLAKLRERERVRQSYWQALDDATGELDGKQRLQALACELDRVRNTPPPRDAWPTTWTRSSCTCATRPDAAADGETDPRALWPPQARARRARGQLSVRAKVGAHDRLRNVARSRGTFTLRAP